MDKNRGKETNVSKAKRSFQRLNFQTCSRGWELGQHLMVLGMG